MFLIGKKIKKKIRALGEIGVLEKIKTSEEIRVLLLPVLDLFARL